MKDMVDDFEAQLPIEKMMYDKEGLEIYKDIVYPNDISITYTRPINIDFETLVSKLVSQLGYKRVRYFLDPHDNIIIGFNKEVDA